MSDRDEFEALFPSRNKWLGGRYDHPMDQAKWEAFQAGKKATRRWRPISEYSPNEHPSIVLVCFEDRHVTAAEYSERLEGGPDDWQGWDSFDCGNPNDDKYHARLMADEWPVYWMPLPEPPND